MTRLAMTLTIALLAMTSLPAAAQAGCFYNGKEVADGTRIGETECRNGIWIELGR